MPRRVAVSSGDIATFSRTPTTRYGGGVKRVLVIGASRGIGLGLVDLHLEDDWRTHATTRDVATPRRHLNVLWHRLDVRDRGQLKSLIGELEPVDRIVHNAGVLRAPRLELMEVNAEAPIRVVSALLDSGRLVGGGTVAIMTSQMGARRGRTGSLGDYGDSKEALNDEFRRVAPDWGDSGAIAVVIHPGWVQTDMGGQGASLTVHQSVTGVKEVLDGLTRDDHGKFLTWDGRVHPW
jgi:NAD(P)-dependent dehydrogenase (short-subunit alcohol dehydrogenase family)